MQITDITRETDDDGVQELIVTMTAQADEVKSFIDAEFKELGKNEVAGFRKGKAPREVIERELGGHDVVYARIVERIANGEGPALLDDADVLFIKDPSLNFEKLPAENQPFTFTISGLVSPVGTLASYDEVSVKMPPNQATDKEVETQIEELRNVYYEYQTITDPDYEIEDGDFVTLRMTVMNDGAVISGLNDVERMIGLGNGSMPASFDEHIIGTKIGYTLDFDFEAKSEAERPELGDGNLHANVEILQVRKRILPEIDDDAFLAKVGAADVEDLKKQMRMTINMQKDREIPKLLEQQVVDALVERFEGEVPQYYFEFMRDEVSRELMDQLKKDGTSLQDFILKNNIEAEKVQAEVTEEATNRAKRDMALEALFREKGWEITDEDIRKELKGNEEADKTIAELKEAHRMADLRKMCRQSKAARWLAQTADIEVVE